MELNLANEHLTWSFEDTGLPLRICNIKFSNYTLQCRTIWIISCKYPTIYKKKCPTVKVKVLLYISSIPSTGVLNIRNWQIIIMCWMTVNKELSILTSNVVKQLEIISLKMMMIKMMIWKWRRWWWFWIVVWAAIVEDKHKSWSFVPCCWPLFNSTTSFQSSSSSPQPLI